MNEEQMRVEFEMEHWVLKLVRFKDRYLVRTTQRAWEKYQRQMEAQPSSCGHSPERCKC